MWKKSGTQTRATCAWVESGRVAEFFFRPQTMTFGSFVVSWPTMMHNISFESPGIGAIGFSLKKGFESTLRYFFFTQKKPQFNYVYFVRVPFQIGIAECRFRVGRSLGITFSNFIGF